MQKNSIQQKDIFDKVMSLPLLRFFEPFYSKNKEILLYLFFGGLTFLISVTTYVYFNTNFGINELVANIMSWIIAVFFAFVTNRVWVFQAAKISKASYLKQVLSFYGGRVFTLAVEELILYVFITRLNMNVIGIKIIAQAVVIILNYVISKCIIFKRRIA